MDLETLPLFYVLYISLLISNMIMIQSGDMQLELFLSSGTVCVSIYSLVAAIFGMNIPYTWNENHEHMFKWVCTIYGHIIIITY